jgi:hypothetical protein
MGPGTAPGFGQGSSERYSGLSGAREGFPDRAALEGFRAPLDTWAAGLKGWRRCGVVECAPLAVCWAGRLAAAVIPSPGSSLRWEGAWGVSHAAWRGQSAASFAPCPQEQTCGRPRAGLRLRWSCGCRMVLGQGADVAIAQAVEDQGEQAAGSGDLRDVLCLLAPAGDDPVLYGADR